MWCVARSRKARTTPGLSPGTILCSGCEQATKPEPEPHDPAGRPAAPADQPAGARGLLDRRSATDHRSQWQDDRRRRQPPAASLAPAGRETRGTALPPLPRRTRQGSLAPQLRNEPSATVGTGGTGDAAWPSEVNERSATALAGFQRGTARARSEATAWNGSATKVDEQ